MLQFYKPNKSNKGTACSFKVSSDCLFLSVIKQSGFNPETQRGIFSGNKDDPTMSGTVQITQIELGGFIDVIENNTQFDKFHKNEKGTSSIKFGPYLKEGKQVGFSLNVVKDTNGVKASFLIGFDYAEARTLKAYLEYSLRSTFIFIEDQIAAKREQYNKNGRKTYQDDSAPVEQEQEQNEQNEQTEPQNNLKADDDWS